MKLKIRIQESGARSLGAKVPHAKNTGGRGTGVGPNKTELKRIKVNQGCHTIKLCACRIGHRGGCTDLNRFKPVSTGFNLLFKKIILAEDQHGWEMTHAKGAGVRPPPCPTTIDSHRFPSIPRLFEFFFFQPRMDTDQHGCSKT